jgi:ATP-dependent Clp protease ATP-binding subunit ClpA
MSVAIEEARQLESKVVCTEHLLLALAREDGSVAQAALQELGLKAGQIRAEITKRLETSSTGVQSPDCGD